MQIESCTPRFWGVREPWRVERVELKLEAGEVHVHLGHEDRLKWTCPECGEPCPLYDHQAERCWRNLDTCQIRHYGSSQLKGAVNFPSSIGFGRLVALYMAGGVLI